MRKKLQDIRSKLWQAKRPILILLIVGVVGAVWLLLTSAATYSVSLEPEGGNLSNSSMKQPASDASGGHYVKFGQSTPSTLPPMQIGSTLNRLGDPDTSGKINEASGLVVSRKNNSGTIFWTHNDSGGRNEIYAIAQNKSILATVTLSGAQNNDWEDIAIGPGPDSNKDYLYVANIGSSSSNPREIYRIQEPSVNINQSGQNITIASNQVEVFHFNSPIDDSEGFFVDPITGDGYLFQKIGSSSSRPRSSTVYTIPASQFRNGGGALSPQLVATITTIKNSGNPGGITGADISSDGKYFVICNYEELWGWPVNRSAGETVSSSLIRYSEGPFYRRFASGWGSESITFSVDRQKIYTLPEGASANLVSVDLTYQ